MPNENEIMKRVQIQATKLGWRLWRNNVGTLKDSNGNYVSYGIQNPGGSDLIGFRRVRITSDMVGQQIAVFAAVEVKTETGKVTEPQANFINFINEQGGVGIIARKEEDLK